MGEQQIQSGAGVRVEAGADQVTHSPERVSVDGQQHAGVALQWKRANPDNKFVKQIESLVKMAGYAIRRDVKQIQRQIQVMEKNR